MSTRNRRSSKEKIAKRHRVRKLIVMSIFCLILAGVYGGGRYYFTSHYFPKTVINGVETGFFDEEKAYRSIQDYLLNYHITIHSEDGELSVTAKDVGLTYINDGELKQILEKQDVDRWFLHLNTVTEHQAMKTSLEDEKLAASIAKLACMNPKEPRSSSNATVIFDESSANYVIKEGQLGNALNVPVFQAAVKEAMLQGQEAVDLLSGQYYLPAEYTASHEKVVKAKEKADKYLKGTVHYEKGDTVLDLKPKRIATFIKIDENYKVALDKDTILKYVQEKVSAKFNTTDSLTVIPSPGGNIYVAKGEGTKAVNEKKEAERLKKIIKEGKAVTREPIYVEEYLYSSNGNIVKDDYVDINIPKQKVYVVKKGKKVVESDCVTGNVSIGRSTPTGIYRIAYKTRNHHMVKYNAFVHYWMPYDTRYGIGLHDATWRSAFGGNIFRGDGSHACINLPLKKAAEIYEEVYAGIPVIVHW